MEVNSATLIVATLIVGLGLFISWLFLAIVKHAFARTCSLCGSQKNVFETNKGSIVCRECAFNIVEYCARRAAALKQDR